MSKYEPLWKWITANKTDDFTLTFAEIESIAGLPIDHSFLTYKKELLDYGFTVGKISMKERTVLFRKKSLTASAGKYIIDVKYDKGGFDK